MNQIIKNRIEKQKNFWTSSNFSATAQITEGSQDKEDAEAKPVPPEVIKRTLDLHYGLEEKQKEDEGAFIFKDLEHFCSWYFSEKEAFLPPQKEALDSLVKARDAIYMGCNCRQDKRKELANEYYKAFFIQNQNTDIIPKIKETLRVKSVDFCKFDEVFLRA
jgi:hypothetical protein